MKKLVSTTTELFKSKQVPDFVKNHSLFRVPVKVEKIFPSIGLPNFQEQTEIDKCFVDLKKEGTYVHNLLRTMSDLAANASTKVGHQADKIQYLEPKENREKQAIYMKDMYTTLRILNSLQQLTDPYDKEVLENAVQTTESKISLRLMKDIIDLDGKVLFKNNSSLFSIFNKMYEKCTSVGIAITSLEQTPEFKIFSKENIPNKKFSIVFSSSGEEGAWDILTMSMRGDWSSCQRWEGEYPRCLVGSVLSKFVGVIYLTSGVMNNGNEKNGNRANLGTKMMRRCVVRYAIDADEGKPCILIDKMYPDLDKDVLNIFVKSIKTRSELPVYYAQELGNKSRHMYLPTEKIREDVLDRDWSYQDSPLKSKNDFNLFILTHNKEEIEREINGFKINLGLFIARQMEDIHSGEKSNVEIEIKKMISNIRNNIPFSLFCDSIVNYIMPGFRAPTSNGFTSSRKYYKEYVRNFLFQRKGIINAANPNIDNLLKTNSSRTVDLQLFLTYIQKLITEFSKQEIKSLIN